MLNREKKNHWSLGIKTITRKLIETTNLAYMNSQRLNQGAWMGLTYALYIHVTVVYLGLFVGVLTMGAGAVPNALTGFWEPILHTGLPCPA